MSKVRRIGLLTAGGDCPGLNAVIRAVTKSADRQSPAIDVIGILDGYAGLVEGRILRLDDATVSGLLCRGGTILGTSNRDNPFKYTAPSERTPRDRSKEALATIQRERLDALIAVGTAHCAALWSSASGGCPWSGFLKQSTMTLAKRTSRSDSIPL